MNHCLFSPSHREARELRYETHIWDNTRDFVQGTVEDHVITPAQKGHYLRAGLGGVIAAGDTFFNITDAMVAGVTGDRLERLQPDDTRIGRDISYVGSHTVKAIGNLLTLHPIRAVGHTVGAAVGVTRAPGDIAMDGVDMFGYRSERGGASYAMAS
jgi:hypothetical protein